MNSAAKKGFNRKHLIIMSLGNIIGSGIFLGSGEVISVAGPAAVLAYAIGGFIMLLEVMLITEMCVVNPAPGAIRVHASEIFGPWIGFVNGWMFWVSGVLGMASEVAAAAIFSRLWFPRVPLWIFCLIYASVMTVINLSDARGLSRIESWLASVKVLALALFVIFGILTLTGVISYGSFETSHIFESRASFMPNGFEGILASMIMVLFSFTGTGIIGLALAETENPEKNAPPAIYTISFLVIILYCLSIFFIVLLTPWTNISANASPYVYIIEKLRIPFGRDILNFIVLTAALSGLNSSMFSASRMLNSLSRDGQAPKAFLKINKNGVPVFALGLSSIVLMLTAVLSYIFPSRVFIVLAASSGFTAMFNWLTVAITHIFYRRKTLKEKPEKLKYKVLGYPFTTILELLLIILVFITSPFYPGQISGLIGSIMLFTTLLIIYFVFERSKVNSK